MRRFIAARVAHAAIVVVLVATIAFFLIRLAPGDPFAYAMESVPETVRAKWRAAYGYDRPAGEQYLRYVGNVARGELGYSFVHHRTVRDLILEAAPRTLGLGLVSAALAAMLGIAVGVFAASRHRKIPDRVISALSVVVYSIPEFWLALLIQLTLGFALGLFPISGLSDPLIADYGTTGQFIVDRLQHSVMPVLALTLLITVVLARYQRAAMIDVLPADYLRTARAKGATERVVLFRHGLRNALMPTITMLGVITPAVFGGIFFIEYVFDWHGLGWLAVTSVKLKDYDVSTACVVVSGVLVAAGTLAADVATAFADPRVRDA